METLEGEKPETGRKTWRQVISGAVLIGFSVAILVTSWNYPTGSLQQMGPGYMPHVIAYALILMGIGIMVSDLRDTSPHYAEPMHWRALIFVSAAVLVFVALIEPAGLVPAMFCAVAASKLANKQSSLLSIVIYSAAVTLTGYLLFIVALGLPLTVFGR